MFANSFSLVPQEVGNLYLPTLSLGAKGYMRSIFSNYFSWCHGKSVIYVYLLFLLGPREVCDLFLPTLSFGATGRTMYMTYVCQLFLLVPRDVCDLCQLFLLVPREFCYFCLPTLFLGAT